MAKVALSTQTTDRPDSRYFDVGIRLVLTVGLSGIDFL